MPHRHFHFSLRWLLLAISLVAVWLGLYAESARKQRAAIAWVRSQGGQVSYAYEKPLRDGSYPPNATPPGPAWLRNLLGVDYFSSVWGVTLDRDVINDLEPLTNFPQLRSLVFNIEVDPETDFSPLGRLNHLESLYLGYTGITRDKLEEIQKTLPSCEITYPVPYYEF